jgi:hypothetical protein
VEIRFPTTKAAKSDLESDSMTFYIINPTSLVKPSALQQLCTELTQFNIAVAIVSESWFTCNHTDQFVDIKGYVLQRKDRVKKKGGGVCMYVRDDIKCSTMSLHPNSLSEYIEVLWSECRYGRVVYYIAACYHPPKARYCDSIFKAELTRDIECILKMTVSPGETVVIVISGDFNSLDTDFLEVDFGLTQIVSQPTHGNKILDKFFTSRPDISEVEVFASLIKTKHRAVFVKQTLLCKSKFRMCERKKVKVYDRRPHHLDVLRHCLGIHDWSETLACEDVQIVYNEFLDVVKFYIDHCVPMKTVRMGRSDPEFITPFIKNMLNKRNKLRKQGKYDLADNLANKINGAIANIVRNQLSKLVDSPVHEMWEAVRNQNNAHKNNTDERRGGVVGSALGFRSRHSRSRPGGDNCVE